MSLLVTVVALLTTRRGSEVISRSFKTIFRNLIREVASTVALTNARRTGTYMALLITLIACPSFRYVTVYGVWAIFRQLVVHNPSPCKRPQTEPQTYMPKLTACIASLA